MFGVYDMKRDALVAYFKDTKNQQTFLLFLRIIRSHHRNRGVLHIVLDNAILHTKPQVIGYAVSHRIEIYFTPTSASWLNRIECHFAEIKKFALDKTDYRSHDEQDAAISQYLEWRNGRRAIGMQSWHAFQRQYQRAA